MPILTSLIFLMAPPMMNVGVTTVLRDVGCLIVDKCGINPVHVEMTLNKAVIKSKLKMGKAELIAEVMCKYWIRTILGDYKYFEVI